MPALSTQPTAPKPETRNLKPANTFPLPTLSSCAQAQDPLVTTSSPTPSSSGLSRGSLRNGFSLVELSIVLVILGLLTGGILAGQSLIRAAQLRAVVSEYQRFAAATNTFRDKYMAIPGDMTNATAFWGKDNAACSTHTGTAATPGTCNGNGNGQVETSLAANTTGEAFQFFKQLALAGLIEGSYSGIAGLGNGYDFVGGANTPKSRLGNAQWGIQWPGNYAGDTNAYAYDYQNTFQFGNAWNPGWSLGAALKPEEVWNIDTKLDDSKPGSGNILPYYWANCTTSATQNDKPGEYKLTNSAIACGMYFARQF